MRIVNYAFHPDYLEDGKIPTTRFKNGTDFALAVAEIPLDKYYLIKDRDYFQKSMKFPKITPYQYTDTKR